MQIWGMEHESSIELSPEDRAQLLDCVRPENSRRGRKGAKSVRVTALVLGDVAKQAMLDFVPLRRAGRIVTDM